MQDEIDLIKYSKCDYRNQSRGEEVVVLVLFSVLWNLSTMHDIKNVVCYFDRIEKKRFQEVLS